MGNYEIDELKELELLCEEYAKKFDLDIKELESEFDKHVEIGEKILQKNKGIFMKMYEHWIKKINPI